MGGLDCHTIPYFDHRALMFIALIATLLGNVGATMAPHLLHSATLFASFRHGIFKVHCTLPGCDARGDVLPKKSRSKQGIVVGTTTH